MLDRIRGTNWLALVVTPVVYGVVLVVMNVTSAGGLDREVDHLQQESRGFITAMLVYPLIMLAFLSPIIFGAGKLHAADVGWRANAIIPAIAVTLIFWLSLHAALLPRALWTGGKIRWNVAPGDHWTAIIAATFAQIFGNALVEETVFRGFLLPQMRLQLSRILCKATALVLAILISQTLFALSHIPVGIYQSRLGPIELAENVFWAFRFGLVLTAIYLVSRNLFISVGLHALWNARPVLLEATADEFEYAWWILTILLLIGWLVVGRLKIRFRESHKNESM